LITKNKCIYLYGIDAHGTQQWIKRDITTEFDTWVSDYGDRQFGYQKLRSDTSLGELHNIGYKEVTENEFNDVFIDVWNYINNKVKQLNIHEPPVHVDVPTTSVMIKRKRKV